MLNAFNSFIRENSLCSIDQKILLAISGGIDSVVLLDLFARSGYSVSLAHCNFQLRGNDSELDQQLVEQQAVKYKTPIYLTRFDTLAFAKQNQLSIEMAARELRYAWFDELIAEHRFDVLATGHHLNDSIETVFLNLCRGTGIHGLTGIPVKNNKIIRPLLFASRMQIEEYAKLHQLQFREDASNRSDKYMRNLIRHQVIPILKKINPEFETTMIRNLSNLNDASQVYDQQISIFKSLLIETEEGRVKINIENLKKSYPAQTILFELIRAYGFNSSDTNQIIQSFDNEPGKRFFSTSHQLLVDRDWIVIEPKTLGSLVSFTINSKSDMTHLPLNLTFEEYFMDGFIIDQSKNVACLDADKISFPLTLRHWNEGDVFFPLGMNQQKKMSDFFIDIKVDRFTKQKIWILESSGQIIWIPGYRIDDRVKITSKTKNVLKISCPDLPN